MTECIPAKPSWPGKAVCKNSPWSFSLGEHPCRSRAAQEAGTRDWAPDAPQPSGKRSVHSRDSPSGEEARPRLGDETLVSSKVVRHGTLPTEEERISHMEIRTQASYLLWKCLSLITGPLEHDVKAISYKPPCPAPLGVKLPDSWVKGLCQVSSKSWSGRSWVLFLAQSPPQAPAAPALTLLRPVPI